MGQGQVVVARSADGRTFVLEGGEAAMAGDLIGVVLPDGSRVLLQAVEPTGGTVLGVLDPSGTVSTEGAPFGPTPVVPAPAQALERLQHVADAGLRIGTWRSGGVEVPALLRASGFNRHTFLCGQSGSGKTYALGVVLEQLLVDTDLRMVVLDPNADFVHLGRPRPGAAGPEADRIRSLDIRVLGAAPPAEPLRMRFTTTPRPAQAAVLRLDPIADRAEYNLFLHTVEAAAQPLEVDGFLGGLRAGGAEERALAQRIENLGLADWEVWAGELPSAWEVVRGGPRATVLDLAGFHDPREASAACLDLVENLWAARHDRTPTLVVIDEAHHLVPAEPSGPIAELLVERLVQVAAEGRKYGLWLLLSTQRPSKVHEQVVSQCDNLMLMRMNSPGDVEDLSAIFGFAPPSMVAAAPTFRQGEALMAGRFSPAPMRVRMGERLTIEGGSDVSVPMAAG
jgi:DNA helicase HerA-like ATPase